MSHVTKVRIQNFRSIGGAIEIRMPQDAPLVLLGANNAGKSNIVRALDLVLGERWPGSFEPEDHDYFRRSRENVPMEITLDVEDAGVGVSNGLYAVDGAGAVI